MEENTGIITKIDQDIWVITKKLINPNIIRELCMLLF